jgi:hypothetical protein
MKTTRRAVMIAAIVAVAGWATAEGAGPSKALTCESAKLKAAGKKEACLANERAKEVLGKTPNYAKGSQRNKWTICYRFFDGVGRIV